MKETIKKIPVLGFLARWFYNLLRLNNLKFRVGQVEEELKTLRESFAKLQAQEEELKAKLQAQEEELKAKLQAQEEELEFKLQTQEEELEFKLQTLEKNLSNMIAKEIFYQSLSLQQRVDQFAFDAKIELKTKIAEETVK
ncbi:MAG: hypothetical protein WC390_10445 [Sulfurimonas sp.]|jgi:hypothetical protein